jgi:hypothetical protein
MTAELTDEPLSYQLHIVPNQDGQNNHGLGAGLTDGNACGNRSRSS